MRFTLKLSERAIGASTCGAWPDRSRPGSSISRRSARASADELPDDELEARLLALPGVGPYAAAHIMMLLGRYSRLILDSWTRPKYLRVSGAKQAKDSTIERRFRRYGPYAGLAFWLYLTRDWVEE